MNLHKLHPIATSLVWAAFCVLCGTASAGTPAVDYNRDVRPILSQKCFQCHGPDAAARQADLRLDVREDAVKDRGDTFAIKPGDPGHSEILARIAAKNPDERMPPKETGVTLTLQEIEVLRAWVQQGAPYTVHWAFVKPSRPATPNVTATKARIVNPIDNFIASRLQREGLSQSPPADRYTLVRRLSLDLTGLPPTPEEVDAFVKETSPTAYEKLVDRLLASPAYGERWAKVWLDLARYADSAGYGSDPLRPNVWPYRDWVIDAFNRNLPYDRFTIEQLAGDLMPSPTEDQLVATAFHRNTMTNTEGGTDDEEFRVAAVKDRAGTTIQVWMGLTMGCAQCHSHKYDPISQKEYYQFFALFNQTEDRDLPDERPTMPVLGVWQRQQVADLKRKIAAIKEKPGASSPQSTAQVAALERELAAIKPTPLPVMKELPKTQQRVSHVLQKGNFLTPGERVEPGLLQAFHSTSKDAPKNRLGVALWLTSRHNPLTARVAVNRFWAQLFGTGIVETEEDFGTQGQLPSHPELLDWLAVEFMDRGWDVKAILKTMVMSATYQQSSRISSPGQQKDPRDRLLWRYPRRRLDAETVRDQGLALAGLLSRKIGGPSVYPPQPDGLWRAAFNGERTWPTSTGEDRYRRGLYVFWRRTVPYPSMATFDAPSRENCTLRRLPTNTPLQAFVTLNDPAFVEMAQALARRIVKEGGSTPAERVRFALKLALSRPADEEQVRALVTLYEKGLAHYRAQPEAAKKMATEPLGPAPAKTDLAELAAWTAVANVLLNLDGVLTQG